MNVLKEGHSIGKSHSLNTTEQPSSTNKSSRKRILCAAVLYEVTKEFHWLVYRKISHDPTFHSKFFFFIFKTDMEARERNRGTNNVCANIRAVPFFWGGETWRQLMKSSTNPSKNGQCDLQGGTPGPKMTMMNKTVWTGVYTRCPLKKKKK